MTSTRSGGATQATTVGYGTPALELVGATKSYGSRRSAASTSRSPPARW